MASFFNKIQRNVRFNFYHYAFSLGVGFFLTPLLVRGLGDEHYGLWIMAGVVTGYMGFLDFGLNRAAVRHIGMCYAAGDRAKLRDVLSSAFFMNIIFGILAFGVLVFANETIVRGFLKVSPSSAFYARAALYVLSGVFLFRFPSASIDAALMGIQRIDILQIVNIAGLSVRSAAILAALAAGGGIIALVGVSLGVAALHFGVSFAVLRRILPESAQMPLRINTTVLREMLEDGFYQTLIGATTQLGFYMDKILISSMLSVAEVTPYHLGGMVAILPFTVSHIFFTPVYAASAELKARKDAEGLKKLFIMGTKASVLVSFTLGLFLFCSAEIFYALWLGPGHGLSSAIMKNLVVIWTLASLNTVGCGIFWGQEPPKWHGFTQAVFLAVSLLAGWLFIGSFGVMGAVYAFATAWFVSFVLLGVKLLKVAGVGFAEFFGKVLFAPAVTLAAAYGIFLLAGPLGYPLDVFAAVVFFAAAGWLFYLSKDEKNKYKSLIKFPVG